MNKKETWNNQLGFILAAAGSAVGLANIWRFPYLVGTHGGSAFVFFYVISLLIFGFPIFLSELYIGQKSGRSADLAYSNIQKKNTWKYAGIFTILNGFMVSAFYSCVAGKILYFLYLNGTTKIDLLWKSFEVNQHNPVIAISFHGLFMCLCVAIIYLGVNAGIEKGAKIMMPLLILLLSILFIRGIFTPTFKQTLLYLFDFKINNLDIKTIAMALGHSFFTLSLGQATMVTYGSYMEKNKPILKSALMVVGMDTFISLFSCIVVMSIVFNANLNPSQGPDLLFSTMPHAFSTMKFGGFFSFLFILLVVLAAITSQISALEPSVAFLKNKNISRNRSVFIIGFSSFLLGVPMAMSANLLDSISSLITNIFIPLGGLLSILAIRPILTKFPRMIRLQAQILIPAILIIIIILNIFWSDI